MFQSKPRLEMEKRVGQLFDSNLETPTSRRSKGSKEKTHPRRLEQIAEELYVAGVALRAEEFITIWVVLGAVIPTFALFLGAPVSLCIGLAIVGASAPIGFVTLKRNKKLALLDKQLPDAMTVICNALRAGQSFQTAMKNVAEEMEEPVSREFMRVYRETQFGMPLETSLTRLVKRTGNPDLDLMCSAVVHSAADRRKSCRHTGKHLGYDQSAYSAARGSEDHYLCRQAERVHHRCAADSDHRAADVHQSILCGYVSSRRDRAGSCCWFPRC